MRLQVKLLHSDAKLPTYGSDSAAGLDLYACEDCMLGPGERACVGTGIAVQWENNYSEVIPDNPNHYYMRIAPRSGLAFKNGIDVFAGVIDEDYRGEIKVILYNSGKEDFNVTKGDRIAQGILTKINRFSEITQVDELGTTLRANGGFGSTGK